ncbi:hypothetical protein GCM10009779_08960 [Polymorphospora rubra]|uniref:Uncharacterized protein n=1 Tax=Polymorphospora rubra TaxID=338584 RepID=A0A810NB79_9ACTN|nr:hypothetical protein Prubr_66650 [Polymorphospora rubra]
MLDDGAVLSVRARAFLDEHAERTPVDLEHPRRWYGCTDVHNDVVPGPEGGLERLETFIARYGGLWFCGERPGCLGKHEHQYRFDHILTSGWEQLEGDEWTATVGDVDGGYPLGLSWSTGRISVVDPDTWIANDADNLIESSALGQAVYADRTWSEAVPVGGRGPGWGLEGVTSDRFRGLVPEALEASSPWNRWYLDEQVAVHAWQVTYDPARPEVVMAWYRGAEGRRRIEAAVGPLQ